MATDTKTETVTFISKYPEQRIVRVQRQDIFDSRGERKIGQRNRETEIAEAEKENRDLLKAGVSEDSDKLMPIDHTPWAVAFGETYTGGEFGKAASVYHYATDDPEIIAWLRSHPGYNSGTGPTAFYEEGAPPDEPEPRLGDQMAAVAGAASTADLDALDEVERSERETHGRKSVLDAIDIARSNLQPVTEAAAEGETPSTLPPSEAA